MPMDVDSILSQNIEKILANARFAPSVHNTQPWKVVVHADTLIIEIDEAHRLRDGDPTGRQTFISLGIFAEAIRLCAAAEGLLLRQVALTESGAVLHFIYRVVKPQEDYVSLLKKRVTDRSIYKKSGVGKDIVAALEDAEQARGVGIAVRTDPAFIEQVAELTSRGIALALTTPGFRRELAHYLVLPWSFKKRGISVRSLYIPWLVSVAEPWMLRLGIGLGKEARLEKKRWLSAGAIICLVAKGDMPQSWFNTGRTYLQIALAVEKLGLSQATSAATVEASTFHEDIEQLLGTKWRLQSTIRIGHGKRKRRHSPRIPVHNLLAK